MALLRKKNAEWKPSENTGLLIGDTIEISDYRRLVESGDADLIDEDGNVLPLPGTVFVCGICFDKIASHAEYVQHVMDKHAQQTTLNKEILEAENEAQTDEDKRKAFGQKMAAARAAKKAEKNG